MCNVLGGMDNGVKPIIVVSFILYQADAEILQLTL